MSWGQYLTLRTKRLWWWLLHCSKYIHQRGVHGQRCSVRFNSVPSSGSRINDLKYLLLSSWLKISALMSFHYLRNDKSVQVHCHKKTVLFFFAAMCNARQNSGHSPNGQISQRLPNTTTTLGNLGSVILSLWALCIPLAGKPRLAITSGVAEWLWEKRNLPRSLNRRKTLKTGRHIVHMCCFGGTETISFKRPLCHRKKEAETASETLCFQCEVTHGQYQQ